MRDGSLSYKEFCVEAELLQRRSHEVASVQMAGSGRSVATWEWRRGNRQHLDGDSYLVSTGNVMPYLAEDEKSEKLTIELDGDIDEPLLVEEEILAEDDEVQTAFQPENVKTALVEFHIVYHTIYQTPVLYFRALAVDGTPLPASVVTRDVQFPGSDGRSTFVAMEEHPVLGKPYSFLHPCETAAAMQLLQAQVRPSSSDINTPSEVKLPQYLASWLSLVQPLTGISPLDYYAVG